MSAALKTLHPGAWTLALMRSWYSILSGRLGLPHAVVPSIERAKRRVPLADGVITVADHWTPRGAAHAPLVLIRTPYGRGMMNLLVARHLAHQGFQVLVQASRGTNGSQGSFDDPFTCEIDDGAATVSWLRQQPFYPGRFFTFGDSYLGYAQLALADAAGDELAGCVLRVAPSSLYQMMWPGGMLAFKSLFSWCLLAAKDPTLGIKSIVRDKRNAPRIIGVGKTAPLLPGYQRLSGASIGFWENWASHPDEADPYWQQGDLRPVLDRLACPVLVQGGWYDLFLEDSLEQYTRLAARGVPVELQIGPWAHAHMLTRALRATLTDATAWLREVADLDRRPAGVPPVRLMEINSEAESGHPAWPTASGGQLSLHLADGGRLTETAPTAPGRTHFRYDPANPTPSVGGATNEPTAGPADNRSLEQRSDVVTFTTEPLAAAVRILGSPIVELVFGSDRSDTCVFVRLCEVRPDGSSTNVTDRLVVLRPESRGDDGTWQVRVTLPPTNIAVAAGNGLRLQLSSGAFPRFLRHPGTGDNPATTVDFHPASQVVHHGGSVRLPLRAAAGEAGASEEVRFARV